MKQDTGDTILNDQKCLQNKKKDEPEILPDKHEDETENLLTTTIATSEKCDNESESHTADATGNENDKQQESNLDKSAVANGSIIEVLSVSFTQ